MTVRIINADVMDGLRQLPDGSVQCIVTSPPYFGLRDYGTGSWAGGDAKCDHRPITGSGGGGGDNKRPNGMPRAVSAARGGYPDLCRCGAKRVDLQIGLEPTPDDFVDTMVRLGRELRRVLRADGTMWLNLGDSYCNTDKWGGGGDTGKETIAADGSVPSWAVRRRKENYPGLKPKDLMGMPWRVALALQADGWWLRRDVVWFKTNPMPESTQDRPTTAHEYLFLLTKAERYFYDAEAIREAATYAAANSPQSVASPHGQGFTRRAQDNAFRHGAGYGDQPAVADNSRPAPGKKEESVDRRKHGFNERWHGGRLRKSHSTNASHTPDANPHTGLHRAGTPREGITRNKRSVWVMATVPFDGEFCTACKRFYDGADKRDIWVERASGSKRKWCLCGRHDAWLSHFATFPPMLPETCILAGTSEKGCCADCGTPWVRKVEKSGGTIGKAWHNHEDDLGRGQRGGDDGNVAAAAYATYRRKDLGFKPGCECASAQVVPCTVLDPFGGAGTTGLVADRLQRDAILIELNPDYAAMAALRIKREAPLTAEVTP